MSKTPKLPDYGEHILLEKKGKKTVWKIYRHPDRVLDNLAILEKIVNKKTTRKNWIVSKDYIDWINSLVADGYNYKIVDDKNERSN